MTEITFRAAPQRLRHSDPPVESFPPGEVQPVRELIVGLRTCQAFTWRNLARWAGFLSIACITLLSASASARADWAPYHGDIFPRQPGPGNFLDIVPLPHCGVAPRAPLHVSITVTWGGGREQGKARFADACNPAVRGEHFAQGHTWLLAASSAANGGPDVGVYVQDINTQMKPVTGAIRLELESAGHRQTLRYQFSQQPGGRIWQGTDAFVNYCIDGPHLVHSSGGNLYCDRPSVTTYRVAA